MVPSDKFVQKIETEYLKLLSDLLRVGHIDFKTAKESAKDLLTSLPFKSYEDLHDKLKKFTEKYPKLEKVFFIFLKYQEEENTQKVLDKMRDLMEKGKINESLKLAK